MFDRKGINARKNIHLCTSMSTIGGDREGKSTLWNIPGSMASRQLLECVNLPGVIKNPMSLALVFWGFSWPPTPNGSKPSHSRLLSERFRSIYGVIGV